jgi:formylglycine-generating enzyme
MKRPIATIVALSSAAWVFAQPAEPTRPQRIALVIANSAYRALPPHATANAEADVMKQALQSAGFDVTTAQDLTRERFAVVEAEFIRRVQSGAVCWVFYSGYAIQSEGIDYLVSIDYDPDKHVAAGVPPGYALGVLQQNVDGSRAAVKVFAIENARTTPKLLSISSAQRLSVPELQDLSQSLVAYATQPNQGDSVQNDGAGLFTTALAKAIGDEGIAFFEVFQQVQAAVQAQSGGRQRPYFVQNITRTWFLKERKKEDTVRVGVSYAHPRDRQEYVWIPAGSFMMGCVASDAKGAKCRPEETPQHKVTLSKNFWIGRNEVETGSYKRFIEANKPRKMPKSTPFWNKKWDEDKDSLPMAFVSWEESRDYCNWIGGRLPTEAEWEYVARAGSKDQVFPHAGSDSREKANFLGKQGNDRYEDPAPVRKFNPNDFGVYDMAGNLWEWVQDWYSPQYYSQSPEIDPQGPNSGLEHLVRGGSYFSDPNEHLRISYRGFSREANWAVGFRCVLPDTPETRKTLAVK